MSEYWNRLLTTKEAADEMRMSPRTLERMRLDGDGPKFVKVRRSVRYRRIDIESWSVSCMVSSTSEVRR
jgi:predicted DNA-binding transcriptional regulator AlpA